MLMFQNYVRAASVAEAHELYQKKRNFIVSGMLWSKMQNRQLDTAIDICDLGLDKVEQTEQGYRIGAMVSLRTLEQHEGLNQLTQFAMADALKQIVGVQFRNVATVGGSLYGRFGFSDVLTLFSVLDATVELYAHGTISMSEFLSLPRNTRDILIAVNIPYQTNHIAYQCHRNSATDFPVLNCAVSIQPETKKIICAVGARPCPAKIFVSDTITDAHAFAKQISEQIEVGSDIRGSGAYRKKLCETLVRRAITNAR